MKISRSIYVVLSFIFLSACSDASSYASKDAKPSSDALLLSAFEESFEAAIARFDRETSREEIASILVSSQLDLLAKYGTTGDIDQSQETGRCLMVSSAKLSGLEMKDDLRRNESKLVVYTDLLKKSDDCLKFFKERLGDSWAKNSAKISVSFFSYTM